MSVGLTGEPGLGGSEGCKGELVWFTGVERDVDGPAIITSGAGALVSCETIGLGADADTSFSAFDDTGGTAGDTALDDNILARICAARSAANAKVLRRNSIRASSCLIFLTKSFTSPGLIAKWSKSKCAMG
jgi:hypothetical protein